VKFRTRLHCMLLRHRNSFKFPMNAPFNSFRASTAIPIVIKLVDKREVSKALMSLCYEFHCRVSYLSCNLAAMSRNDSVGITTGYGLEGWGLIPGRRKRFLQSRPVLGTTQPPLQWVPAPLSLEVKQPER
jgi:hypothetical protein